MLSRCGLVERGENSGPWPCEFPEAAKVKLQIPSQVAPTLEPPIPPVPPIAPGTLVAQAELRPDEIQNLAESMGDLLKATAGLDLKFSLRIELSGDGEVGSETTDKVNDVLAEVADGLRFDEWEVHQRESRRVAAIRAQFGKAENQDAHGRPDDRSAGDKPDRGDCPKHGLHLEPNQSGRGNRRICRDP